MDGRDLRGMFAHFETLVDPRVERTRRHELNDIVAIAVLAVISGADGFTDMHTFAETKLPWLKTFLNLHNGVPSHDTFGRVLAALAGVTCLGASSPTSNRLAPCPVSCLSSAETHPVACRPRTAVVAFRPD